MSKFIAIEGADGTGKTTLVESLVQLLNQNDIKAVFFRDPGCTELGEHVRKYLQMPNREPLDGSAELLLFNSLKMQLYRHKILPALQEGKVVITDRYSLSTIVYQGYAREQYMLPFLSIVESLSPPDPDAYIVLQSDVEIIQQRLAKRYAGQGGPEFYEKDTDYLRRVVDGYRNPSVWTDAPTITIDTQTHSAKATLEKAYASVVSILQS